MDISVGGGLVERLEIDRSLPTSHLPEELILDTLLLLPVKSIVRFRCVCKSWYSLLTSSNFASRHLQYSRRHFYLLRGVELIEPELPLGGLGLGFPKFKDTIFTAPDGELDRWVHTEPPNPKFGSKFFTFDGQVYLDLAVIGSIDGLICISYNGGTCIMLWNPATRQSYQVPRPEVSVSGLWSFSIGLARYNNGYKVVRAVYGSSNQFPLSIVKAEVYDLKSNLWKVTVDPPQLHFDDFRCSVIANGVPYWKSDYDVLAFDCSDIIAWFDPIHDKFETMRRPEFGSGDSYDVWRLGVIREALVIIVQKSDGGMDVWEMIQSGGWNKQFSVGGMEKYRSWLGCWKDGEFVLRTDDVCSREPDLFLYDHLEDTTKALPKIESMLQRPIEVFLYQESLVRPHSLS